MSFQVAPFPQQQREPFRKTEKQIEACNVMNHNVHSLLYGGSRSGKTFISIRNMILRGLKAPSRHLIVRYRFNHAKTSIWYDTLPKVFKLAFPGLQYKENKNDWFVEFPAQNGSGMSQIWLGGIDDKERSDKVLGNEYSTILANEVSQINYNSIITLRTRLAENSGLNLRFYYDLNPVGKKHWSYQEFIQKVVPDTDGKEKSTLNTGYLVMNPYDNIANLPPEYIKILKSLPKRQRQRFLDGLFLTDVEGALWTDQMVTAAKARGYGEIVRKVVAVDPAVSHKKDSDETGIVIVGLDEFGDGVILDDWSGKMSTANWARRVVKAYEHFNCNSVVVETNQGGDLVRDSLKNINSTVKIVDVRASNGKFARAEPVSELYELGIVSHAKDMPELEAQLTEWVPLDSDKSPDRLDALVWGLTHLLVRKIAKIHVG